MAHSKCKSPEQSKFVFLESLSKSLAIYLDTQENVIILGDLNITSEDKNLQLFVDSFNLEHLIKKPACFKGSLSCIDLINTDRKACFKKTCIVETATSDFHKITAVSLKSQILKAPSKWKLKAKEKGNLITDNKKLANLFNSYFINITDNLKLKKINLKISISLWNFFTDNLKLKKISLKISISLKFFLFMRIMAVFLKSNKIISFQKNFVSKSYHLMKSKRLYKLWKEKNLPLFLAFQLVFWLTQWIFIYRFSQIMNDSLKTIRYFPMA